MRRILCMRSLQEHGLHVGVIEDIVVLKFSVSLLLDEIIEFNAVYALVILLFQCEVLERVVDALWASCS